MFPKVKTRSIASGVTFAGLLFFLALSPPEGLAGLEGTPKTAPQQVNPDGYTSARVCGECHQDIYESWKGSLHAFSLTDPVFDTAFMQALRQEGDSVRRVCLRCHAPMTMFNGDYELAQGVTREGVSCDFCHTITTVHLDNAERPFELSPGLVKRSTIEVTSSPAHQVAYSELHATADLCGGCHNFVSPAGAAVLTTYEEWRAGPYGAQGIPCQSCHMAVSPGRVAEVPSSTSRQFNLHRLIRDTDQLRSALTVEITRALRNGDGLDVEVAIENVGSGHKVPTGMPTREVVLTVTAQGGSRSQTGERRYGKVVADSDGNLLKTDVDVLLRGATVMNDTRIAPGERRVERLRFTAFGPEPVTLNAALSYEYAPAILDVRRMQVRLAEAQRIIR
ncbi:MAG: multiheme c-type cytochrome [Acidobacteriota bacterium]|jgi:hypothetical protein